MSKAIPTARDLSNEIQLRTSKTIGPWKLNADDAQWAQAGKWSHAVAIGIIGAWFMAVAALTGGPVNAATPELAPRERGDRLRSGPGRAGHPHVRGPAARLLARG